MTLSFVRGERIMTFLLARLERFKTSFFFRVDRIMIPLFVRVDRGRLADKKCLRVGDELLSINDHPCAGMTHAEAVRLLTISRVLRLKLRVCIFFISCICSFRGKNVSCEIPQVMPHSTSGWSLRWFHHRLLGIVGALCD